MTRPATIQSDFPQTAPDGSINGTIAEVAAFFNKSVRTVQRWYKPPPGEPEMIGHWCIGRCLVFGECHIVACWLKFNRDLEGLLPGVARTRAVEAWRSFIRAYRAAQAAPVRTVGADPEVADLKKRVAALEAMFSAQSVPILYHNEAEPKLELVEHSPQEAA